MSDSQAPDSYTLRLPASAVVLTSVFWITSMAVGLFFMLRAFGGQRAGSPVARGGGPSQGTSGGGLAVPVSIIAIALVVAFSMLLVSAWRTRVIVDHLSITHRGLFRTQRIASERIERISLGVQRGSRHCVVESLGHKMRLSLDLRDAPNGTNLPGALLRMMPDKMTPDLRKLAAGQLRPAPPAA